MTITRNLNGTLCLNADEGRALKRKTDLGPTRITRVSLASSDSPEEWTDCDYAQNDEDDQSKDGPKTYSKLRIKLALAKLGKLQLFESLLSTFEIADGYQALAAWNDAQDISDGFDGFNEFYSTALSALGMTKEQGDQLLEQARTA